MGRQSYGDLVATSDKPLSKADIARRVTGGSTDKHAAIKRLEGAGEIVQVVGEGAARKGGCAPFWTPERASTAGLTMVPNAVNGHV